VYEFKHTGPARYSPLASVIVASGAGAIALDSHNDLFVSNSAGAGVDEYKWSGGYPATGTPPPGTTQLASLDVTAIAFDTKNDLFVAAGDQALEFAYDKSAGTYAATGTVLATVTGGLGGVAVDTHGDLYVSDSTGNLVQEYAPGSSTPVTVASGLNDPTTLAVARSGDLYVFNAGADQILEYSGGTSTTLYTGLLDNSPQTGGVATSRTGAVFFGNNYNSAVVYEIP
jgi:hypothetical protein